MKEEVILAIEIFQPFAQYRNPFTFEYAQTYPLPPKSTIIGMLQNALNDWYGNEYGIEKWWSLKISIHGGFESVFWNYQQLIKGDINIDRLGRLSVYTEIGKDRKKEVLPLYNKGFRPNRSPTFQQELFNGHIYIFVKGESEFIEKIKKSLEFPEKVLYLGRSEDVVFIRKLEFVKAKKTKTLGRGFLLNYPMYIKLKEIPLLSKKYGVYSIPIRVIFENNEKPVSHKAEIDKLTKRDVKFEPVIYTSYKDAIRVKEKTEIEVFEFDEKEFKIPKESGWL